MGVRGDSRGPRMRPVGVMSRELSLPMTHLVFLTLLLASILPFSPIEPRPGTEAHFLIYLVFIGKWWCRLRASSETASPGGRSSGLSELKIGQVT